MIDSDHVAFHICQQEVRFMVSFSRSRYALLGIVGFAVTGIAVAGNGRGQSPLKQLVQALKQEVNSNPDFDPTGNDPLAQETRATFLVKSFVAPSVIVEAPLDGTSFAENEPVTFDLQLVNWSWRPDLATNAGTEYANGDNIPNIGHLHGWVYDLVTGERVRFYGANLNRAVTYDPNTGSLSFTDTYPPGIYKMYFQAQNNDHTAQAVPAAPNLPAIDTVVFSVGDVTIDDLPALQ